MAVPTIPSAISLNDINIELGQGSGTTNMNMNTQASQHLPSALSQPHGVNEWSGYSHVTYGTMDGDDDWTPSGARLYGNSTFYYMSSTQTTHYTATGSPQSTYCRKANGTTFSALTDNCSATCRRRAKGTGDAFVAFPAATWNAKTGYYASQSYSCDFSTYDYLWWLRDI